jgi:hypothetical protein
MSNPFYKACVCSVVCVRCIEPIPKPPLIYGKYQEVSEAARLQYNRFDQRLHLRQWSSWKNDGGLVRLISACTLSLPLGGLGTPA